MSLPQEHIWSSQGYVHYFRTFKKKTDTMYDNRTETVTTAKQLSLKSLETPQQHDHFLTIPQKK